ncbi:aspartate aminotransferase family protein [Amycolatopsis sp. GM8]|uniref:aspartate aminotransferase family protein n=1 Tax=Amycolatopsis sp. GM8 TaxID=2896530 RepID=UPI001F00EFB2|nr:aminotransferase class III-fold pyridoxal phosphate-dependent enzyme [Amycolatopsis sp. GM8]
MLDTRDDALAAALEDSQQRYTTRNPISETRFHEAAETLPGGNTRTSLYYSPFPVAFASGQGKHLTDLDGHVYTDFLGEYSAGLYGHSHPVIMAAAREALDHGIALGGPNTYDAELAALLVERFPSLKLVRFTNSGTEANLMAIATARVVTGRPAIMVFENGYHGSVLSFRGASPINAPYPFVVCEYNDVDEARRLFEEHGDDIAAVLVEPMLGGGGAIPATREFLAALQEGAAEYGALFILDEVMTSRLGPSGLQGPYELRPDLTTFGKYVGGGFSFGAFGGRRELMARFDPTAAGSLGHPGTFNNNTLSMAAGAAGLRDVFTPEVAVAHNARGDLLRERLNAMFAERNVTMQATGIGSIIGLHFQTTPIARARDVVPANAKRALLHLEMMARGFYFARRGYLALPLPLEQKDLDDFVGAMTDVVEEFSNVLR